MQALITRLTVTNCISFADFAVHWFLDASSTDNVHHFPSTQLLAHT